jgi:hypothetical protein
MLERLKKTIWTGKIEVKKPTVATVADRRTRWKLLQRKGRHAFYEK